MSARYAFMLFRGKRNHFSPEYLLEYFNFTQLQSPLRDNERQHLEHPIGDSCILDSNLGLTTRM